jgi:hypothetical protein
LKTTLERACESYDIPLEKARVIEDILLRNFMRKYHHYSQHIPDRGNTLEWLSVMQHYGAPTRLLDFTYSVYVAAYFALEKYWEKRKQIRVMPFGQLTEIGPQTKRQNFLKVRQKNIST